MKERIAELDIVRGLAIIGVVAIHATVLVLPSWSRFSPTDPGSVFVNQFFRYATPVFIFLSGLTLTLAWQKRPLRFMQFYRKRLGKVILPYVLWTALFTLIYRWPLDASDPAAFVRNLWTGKADYHMYFLLLLLQCYLLFPLLLPALVKLKTKILAPTAGVLLCLQALGMFIYMQQRVYGTGVSEDVGFRFSGFWLVYFCVGIICGLRYQQCIRSVMLIPRLMPVGAMAAGALFLTWETIQYANFPFYDALNFFRPFVVGYVVIATVGLFSVALSLSGPRAQPAPLVRQVLTWLGQKSLLIYFVHTIVLAKLSSVTGIGSRDGLWATIVLIPATLAVCALMVIIYQHLKRVRVR